MLSERLRPEAGAATVDFALVSVLVVALALGVVQLALGLHVRNVLTDAAGEGARRAALAGGSEQEGQARVRALVSQALSEDYAQDVVVTRTRVQGLAVVRVEVSAPLPVLGLLGPGGTLRVSAHAVDEQALVPSPAAPRGAGPGDAPGAGP